MTHSLFYHPFCSRTGGLRHLLDLFFHLEGIAAYMSISALIFEFQIQFGICRLTHWFPCQGFTAASATLGLLDTAPPDRVWDRQS